MKRASDSWGPAPTTLKEALAENSKLRKLVTKLDAHIEKLDAHIEKLDARVEELERRLGQSSRNSSRPPSSDSPTSGTSRKKPTGRKPGGQPGHKGHQRKLLPPEKVDKVEEVWPERCENCDYDLSQEALQVEVGEAVRHQVTELPIAPAEVTEYQLHTQYCSDCGHATAAALPPGVPTGCFGPRLQGTVAVLSGVYRLSKRTLKAMLADLFGAQMSLGSISACEQRTSAAVAAPVAEAHAYVQTQPVANADETGWRERRNRAWLWVAVTAQVTVFMIHAQRGVAAAKKLLGRFAGILGSDRWCAYAKHLVSKRQLCWAHLRRHFVAFSEYRGTAGEIGSVLLDVTDLMFQWWHRVRDGTMARSTFRKKMGEFRVGFEGMLGQGTTCGRPKVDATCREILKLAPALWTFVRVEGVEPTNNAAERAIRPAVLLRKGSFGTHSEDGSRFVERMLSVAATLKQQGRNVVEYVTEACERALHQRRPRSLLPGGHIMTPHALSLATQPPGA